MTSTQNLQTKQDKKWYDLVIKADKRDIQNILATDKKTFC